MEFHGVFYYSRFIFRARSCHRIMYGNLNEPLSRQKIYVLTRKSTEPLISDTSVPHTTVLGYWTILIIHFPACIHQPCLYILVTFDLTNHDYWCCRKDVLCNELAVFVANGKIRPMIVSFKCCKKMNWTLYYVSKAQGVKRLSLCRCLCASARFT